MTGTTSNPQIPQRALVHGKILAREATENYLFKATASVRECLDRGDSDRCRELERVSVRAGADGRECNGFEIVLSCQPKRRFVTGGQKFWLTPTSAPPYWADGMDNPTCFEAVCFGDTSFAGWTSADLATLFQKAGPRGIVNRSVNTATPEKAGVRSIHDRVDIESGDVATDGMYSDGHVLPWKTANCSSRAAF